MESCSDFISRSFFCSLIFSSLAVCGVYENDIVKAGRTFVVESLAFVTGTFIPASAESYKGKLRDLLAWYIKKMKEMDIEIHLNEKITDLSRFEGKDIVVATGAIARKLNVPGFDKTIEACDFLNGEKVGNNVAVIGGGLTGCEIAYELALTGKKPIIVEMKDDLVSQVEIFINHMRNDYPDINFALGAILPIAKEGNLSPVCQQYINEYNYYLLETCHKNKVNCVYIAEELIDDEGYGRSDMYEYLAENDKGFHLNQEGREFFIDYVKHLDLQRVID